MILSQIDWNGAINFLTAPIISLNPPDSNLFSFNFLDFSSLAILSFSAFLVSCLFVSVIVFKIESNTLLILSKISYMLSLTLSFFGFSSGSVISLTSTFFTERSGIDKNLLGSSLIIDELFFSSFLLPPPFTLMVLFLSLILNLFDLSIFHIFFNSSLKS